MKKSWGNKAFSSFLRKALRKLEKGPLVRYGTKYGRFWNEKKLILKEKFGKLKESLFF
jgi:hypothetical protein